MAHIQVTDFNSSESGFIDELTEELTDEELLAINGGGRLWNAFKRSVFTDKAEAIMDVFHEVGKPTKAETILNLVEPVSFGFIRHLFS